MRSHWWGHTGGGIPIYPNMIWPYSGDLVDGISWFNNYNGRSLRGTNSDSLLGTGKTGSPGLSLTSTTDGGHSYPADIGIKNGRSPSGDDYVSLGHDTAQKGAHPHQLAINYTAAQNRCHLVIANEKLSGFPVNSLLFSGSSATMDGCAASSLFNSYGGVLTANTSNMRRAATATATCTTVSIRHGHTKDVAGSRVHESDALEVGESYMTHDHQVSLSITLSLYRVILKVWQATEEIRSAKNAKPIVMSLGQGAAPPGWKICDGTGGTPNTLNRWIYNSGTPGLTINGNNTVSIFATLLDEGHKHDYWGVPDITGVRVPHKEKVYHRHTASGTKSWYPPYVYVKFLQFEG